VRKEGLAEQAKWTTFPMANTDEYEYAKFKRISTSGRTPSAFMDIRFGEAPADPHPFILTVQPSYVARELRKTLPLNISDVQDYCKKRLEDLRKIAFRVKQTGKTTDVPS
jgi:hypothetical protein